MSLAALMARVDSVSIYQVAGGDHTLTVTRGSQTRTRTFTAAQGEAFAGLALYEALSGNWQSIVRVAEDA